MADTAPAPPPAAATEGPALICPVPRRPLHVNVGSPMPSHHESVPGTPRSTTYDVRFLDRRCNPALAGESRPVSRQASFQDLITPTLLGIYSSSAASHDPFYQERRRAPASPWGSTPDTPSRRCWAWDADTTDTETELPRRRTGPEEPLHVVQLPPAALSPAFESLVSGPSALEGTVARAYSLAVRTLLLFLMGVGCGTLIARLPSGKHSAALGRQNGSSTMTLGWRYWLLWGLIGVILGTLLPYLDGSGGQGRVSHAVRDATRHGATEAPSGSEINRARGVVANAKNALKRPAARNDVAASDWALMVRRLGAFVGIVLAIRRLA